MCLGLWLSLACVQPKAAVTLLSFCELRSFASPPLQHDLRPQARTRQSRAPSATPQSPPPSPPPPPPLCPLSRSAPVRTSASGPSCAATTAARRFARCRSSCRTSASTRARTTSASGSSAREPRTRCGCSRRPRTWRRRAARASGRGRCAHGRRRTRPRLPQKMRARLRIPCACAGSISSERLRGQVSVHLGRGCNPYLTTRSAQCTMHDAQDTTQLNDSRTEHVRAPALPAGAPRGGEARRGAGRAQDARGASERAVKRAVNGDACTAMLAFFPASGIGGGGWLVGARSNVRRWVRCYPADRLSTLRVLLVAVPVRVSAERVRGYDDGRSLPFGGGPVGAAGARRAGGHTGVGGDHAAALGNSTRAPVMS